MGDPDGAARRGAPLDEQQHRFELAINGCRLTLAQVAAFKQLTGARILEPGRYWLDPDSGNMGIEGESRPRLNLYRACLRQGMSRRSLAMRAAEGVTAFGSGDGAALGGAL